MDILKLIVGAERGAERAENRVERSGAVSGRCRETTERSGALSGRTRSGNGAESGGYRNRLERGAAFSPAPLRSHALFSGVKVTPVKRGVPSVCFTNVFLFRGISLSISFRHPFFSLSPLSLHILYFYSMVRFLSCLTKSL